MNARKTFCFESGKNLCPSHHQMIQFGFHLSSELNQQHQQKSKRSFERFIHSSESSNTALSHKSSPSSISKTTHDHYTNNKQKIPTLSSSIITPFPSSFSKTHHHRSSFLIIHSSSSSPCRHFSQSLVVKNMHTFYEILLVPNNEGETTISFFTNGKRYVFSRIVCIQNNPIFYVLFLSARLVKLFVCHYHPFQITMIFNRG